MRADLKRLKREIETGKNAAVSEAESAVISGTSAPDPVKRSSGKQPKAPSGTLPTVEASRNIVWKIAVPALVLLGAVGGWLYYSRFRTTGKLTAKDTILVADFTNTTGDPIFNDTLKQALGVSLRQSPFLNVVSDARVTATLKMMTRPTDTPLLADVAREVCQRADSKAYISGSIASLGNQYVVGLKAVNCLTGDVLAQEQVTAAGKEKVLDGLGEAAGKLRGELGESLASVQKFDAPLAQETTPSLEALKAMSLARKAEYEKGSGAALPFFQRAIELDPNFASAIEGVGIMYNNLGQSVRASEHLSKAFALRDRASEREKFHIASMYYMTVTGELEKAVETFREWAENYPHDDVPHTNLGSLYTNEGKFEQAVEQSRESLRFNPGNVIGYENLVGTLVTTNRFDEAKKAYDEAMARKLDDDTPHLVMYGLFFVQGDAKGMAEQVAWFDSHSEFEHEILAMEADTEAYAGRIKKARELSQRSVQSAIRADNKEAAAQWQVSGAWREAVIGNLAEARSEAVAALELAPTSRDVQAQVAAVFARIGEGTRAKALAENLNKQFPLHTVVQTYWLPTIQGQSHLVENNSNGALESLRSAAPLELTTAVNNAVTSCALPVYIRGEAYLAAGQGTAAAAEFQKLVDHSGLVLNCVAGALAHLQLGRAYAAAGDKVKARAAYQDFLNLWKDADPDVPVFKEAKTELAKLQ